MQAFAQFLDTESAELSPEQRSDYHRRITTAASRLDKLIQDALNYNKAVLEDAGLEPVDLSSLVCGILKTYPNLHPENANITVEGKLPVIYGNESLLTQCFSNLLGNAVKFVAPGVRPNIRVWAEPSPSAEALCGNHPLRVSSRIKVQTKGPWHYVRICVQDNGIGIAKPAQARLFRMFERLSRGYEGTGVGLAIVRKVVEKMGGRVGAESEAEKGSLFWVDLLLWPSNNAGVANSKLAQVEKNHPAA
jgi:signal transduction histidine kinase